MPALADLELNAKSAMWNGCCSVGTVTSTQEAASMSHRAIAIRGSLDCSDCDTYGKI